MKPLALDLFCCAGGSATGLERAGFDVIGIDWKPSHHWTGSGELHAADLSTADAVEAVIRAFAPDFVSASPPCQRYSSATPTRTRNDHADLIPAAREGILRSGVPGWIENVQGAPLHHAIRLCGSMFPETQRLRRHRWFELIGWFALEPEHTHCTFEPVSVAGHGPPDNAQSREYRRRRDVVTAAGAGGGNRGRGPRKRREVICTVPGATSVRGSGNGQDKEKRVEWRRKQVMTLAVHAGHGPGQTFGQNRTGPECIRWREAMGWIDGPRDQYSLAQAIPPAYAEWLGRAFLRPRAVETLPAGA